MVIGGRDKDTCHSCHASFIAKRDFISAKLAVAGLCKISAFHLGSQLASFQSKLLSPAFKITLCYSINTDSDKCYLLNQTTVSIQATTLTSGEDTVLGTSNEPNKTITFTPDLYQTDL